MSAFQREFQELAGKIVNSGKFWDIVDARVALDSSEEEFERYAIKLISLSPEDRALCDALQKERSGEMYVIATDHEETVAAPTLAAQTLEEARTAFLGTLDALLKNKDTLHMSVQPKLRLAFVLETGAVAQAYLEAAQSCTDERARLKAGELITLGDANRALRAKLDSKFGKFTWF